MTLMIRLTLFFLLVLTAPLHAINILILGSSEGFEKREMPKGHDTHLDLKKLGPEFERVLNKGKSGHVKVTYQDIYTTKDTPAGLGSAGRKTPTTFHCHSLAQYIFWPEGREARLANLQNKGATKWDYIYIIGDPYLIGQMPGIYAEGVHLVMEQISKGEAKAALVMPWHSNEKINGRIPEVVQRVAAGLKLPVAPAGMVWSTQKGRLQPGQGEYIAASSMFSGNSNSAAWGKNMAERKLAKTSLAAIKHIKSNPLASEYGQSSPFYPESLDKEFITYCQTGTSSEAGIRGGLNDAIKRIGSKLKKVSCNGDNIDFNYGRANSNFEPNKRYKVNPDKYGRSYGFPMQEQQNTASTSMPYGIDKRYFHGRSYDDGTDLGIAYDMIRQGEIEKRVYAVPVRLLLCKLMAADPSIKPLRDRWHMSRELDTAIGCYMVTILTGKNPVGDEPTKDSKDWKAWLSRKVGYETAMRMGRLTYDPK
jgi:hypothetical protein